MSRIVSVEEATRRCLRFGHARRLPPDPRNDREWCTLCDRWHGEQRCSSEAYFRRKVKAYRVGDGRDPI